MQLFREYLKKYKWFVFAGNAKEGETAIIINSEEEGWLEKGKYFEAIPIALRTYKIGLTGNTGWNRGDMVSIDRDDLLQVHDNEKDAIKYSELTFDGWDDPEGDRFSDKPYDRLDDIGIVHK